MSQIRQLASALADEMIKRGLGANTGSGGSGGGRRPPGPPSRLHDNLVLLHETNFGIERLGGCASVGGKNSKS